MSGGGKSGSGKIGGGKGTAKGRRYGATRVVGALVPGLTKKTLGKRGFTTATIITDWPQIVGEELARQSQPERLRFPQGKRDGGTLQVRVDGPLATELMHLEPQVVERINGHFGYRAVAELKLIQAPLRGRGTTPNPDREGRERRRREQTAAPDPAALSGLDARLDSVEDPEMRETLRRLGTSVLRRESARGADAESDTEAADETAKTDTDDS